MLQLDPISRPSLAEIRSHEWFNEPIPTHEEVKSEFMKRKALIDTNREAKSHEDAPMDEPDPSVFVNAAFRDIGGSSEEGKIDSSSKEPGIYVPEIKRATQFYSTSDLQVLYNTLVIFANKTTKEIKLSAFDYSVEMD